jgi:hypothetical protein
VAVLAFNFVPLHSVFVEGVPSLLRRFNCPFVREKLAETEKSPAGAGLIAGMEVG